VRTTARKAQTLGRGSSQPARCAVKRTERRAHESGGGMNDSGNGNDDNDRRRDDSPRDGPEWSYELPFGAPGVDDLRQYLFKDSEGAYDGCWTWSSAEAVGRALQYGLIVVERRWGYVGERVYWPLRVADWDGGAKDDDSGIPSS
jgi:hypothetical protein